MPWDSVPSHTGPNAVPAAVAGWRDHSLEFCRNFYLRRFEVCSSSLSNTVSCGRATMAISCKGAHFPPEVILMGIRWYLAIR
jgi:hypothetical protein